MAGCNNNAPVLGISQKHFVAVQLAGAKCDQSGPIRLSKAMVTAATAAVSTIAAINRLREIFIAPDIAPTTPILRRAGARCYSFQPHASLAILLHQTYRLTANDTAEFSIHLSVYRV